jgi:DNA-directed RNA polymerase specialized sigma24 family protein
MSEEFETVNGAWRAPDGRFWMLPHRQFPADGRKRRPLDRLHDLVRRYERLLPYTGSPSLEVSLRAIRDARRQLDEIECEAVAVARGSMWSWRDVAEVLGMSVSAAHKRFARVDVPPRKRR